MNTTERISLRKSRLVNIEVETGNRSISDKATLRKQEPAFGCETDYERKNDKFVESQNESNQNFMMGRSQPQNQRKAGTHERDSNPNNFYATTEPVVHEAEEIEDGPLKYNIHHNEGEKPERTDLEESDKQYYYNTQQEADMSRKNQEFAHDPEFQMTNNVHHDSGERPEKADEYDSDKQYYYNTQQEADMSRKNQEFAHDPEFQMTNNVHHDSGEKPQKANPQDSDKEYFYNTSQAANEPPKRCGEKHDNPVFNENPERICLYKKKHGM